MKPRMLWILLPVTLVMLAGGCGEKNRRVPTTGKPLGQQPQAMPSKPAGSQNNSPNLPNALPATPQTSAVVPAPEQSREDFCRSVQENIDGVQTEITKLEARMKEGSQDLQIRYQNEFKPALTSQLEDLKARLAKAKDQAEPDWEKFKGDLRTAVTDLKSSYDKAVEALK